MIDLITSATTPFSVAKTLALRGLAVFPVRSRRPLTARGFYSATSDIHVLPQLNWADADGVGMPTGEVSGIDVLDVDVRGIGADVRARTPGDRKEPLHDIGVDGFAALANLPALPSTLSASTPRNGRHFYFRHVVGGRNRKLGDGSVEWFSTGKLVVVPPAPGRAWLNQAEIAEAPDWLKALVSAPKPIHTQDMDHEGGSSGPQVTEPDLQSQSDRQVPRDIYFLILRGMPRAKAQTQRRVRGLWKNLAEKADHRNDGLNYTAWQFSQFIGAGDLNREIASKLLWLACKANGYLDKDGPDVIDEVINRVLTTEETNDA